MSKTEVQTEAQVVPRDVSARYASTAPATDSHCHSVKSIDDTKAVVLPAAESATGPETSVSSSISTQSFQPLVDAYSNKNEAAMKVAIADLKTQFPALDVDITDVNNTNTEVDEEQSSQERLDYLNKSIVSCCEHLAKGGLFNTNKQNATTTLFLHPPVYTCEQARTYAPQIIKLGVVDMKNLFLKDKKKNIYLVSANVDTKIDLKTLGKRLQVSGGISFANNEVLMERTGLVAGSVTPFGLINDMANTVDLKPTDKKPIRFILDDSIFHTENPYLGFHPNACNACVTMHRDMFVEFIENYTGHAVERLDLEC